MDALRSLRRLGSRRAVGAGNAGSLLAQLDEDLARDGRVAELAVQQDRVEEVALGLVRTPGLRARDAWHLAVASLAMPGLTEGSETLGFATRDEAQTAVAGRLGFERV